MQSAPKPLAALSSGLLARKGEARPAMRRHATLAEAGEELGWNDMGEPGGDPSDAPSAPPVLAQREDLAEALDAPIEDAEPASRERRAAFTLRLDSDRHMRMRLAAATRRISAQQLVTQALDQFLTPTPVADAPDQRTRVASVDRGG